MIKSVLIVGIGSFIGGALRYLISTLFKQFCTQGFPWGTLLVNLMGCFIFGAIFALFSKYSSTSHPWCLLLTTGLCGGFTTFSTFAYESVLMLQQGNLSGFISYIATSLIAGISVFALGYWIFK